MQKWGTGPRFEEIEGTRAPDPRFRALFHLFEQKPTVDGFAPIFFTYVGVADGITCDKFLGDQLKGIDFAERGSRFQVYSTY